MAEVLVGVLISSMGLVMLAAMITSSYHIVLESRNVIENYVNSENVLVEQVIEHSDENDPVKVGEGTVMVKSDFDSSLRLTDDDLGGGISVSYYTTEFAGKTVISYREIE